MSIRFLAAIIICIHFYESTIAQNNLGLWTGVKVSKKLGSNVQASLNGQTRLGGTVDFLHSYLFDFGIEYKISKKIDIGGYYRWINRRKEEGDIFENRQRYYLDLKYVESFGKIDFLNRVRYQHLFKDNEGDLEFVSNYIRNRIDLGFKASKRFEPYISADFFYSLGDNKFDQIRPRIGADIKLNKKNGINTGLMTNLDLTGDNKAYPIIYLNYRFKI
jgi:hypothetical protein